MLSNILLLIIEAVGGFFTVLFLGRLYMQWAGASFRNELGQFVVKLTDWAVVPLRRLIPGLFGLDLASLFSAWMVQSALVLLGYWLRGFFSFASNVALSSVLVLALGLVETARVFVYVLIVVVIVVAVLSWVNPHSPLAPLFSSLARPFLRPLQRIVPTVANIDLSPLVALLLFQVVLMLLAYLRGGLTPMIAG